MTFLELLQKKFFPKKYQEKQALKERAAQHMADKEATTQATATALADQEAQAGQTERQSVLQRSKSYGVKRKNRPIWLQRLEAILPTQQGPIRRFLRRYHVGKILLILMGTFVLLLGSYLFYLSKTAKVSDLQDALKATTVIYDRKGEYAGSLSGQKGTYVELDAISDDLEKAVIATEDRTFYTNNGINLDRKSVV